ncbi:MAG: hypothetical protein ABGY41_17725 [Candidatus Poribacteria bacterium]
MRVKAIGRFGFQASYNMVYSPTGALIAASNGSSLNREIQLLDATTGRLVVMFPGALGLPPAFSPDERTVATSSPGASSDSITLWGVESGQEFGRLEGKGIRLAFSPDGRLIAGSPLEYDSDGGFVSGIYRGIALWDVATREKIATFGGDDRLTSLVFSPDGATLASSSGDGGAITLWDVATRREVATLAGSASLVLFGPTVRFSPAVAVAPSSSGMSRLARRSPRSRDTRTP